MQALVDAEAQLYGAPAAATAPAVVTGFAATQAAAPMHAAPVHQVAARDALNAVITVVARGPDGAVLARWRARGHWVGQLPARYHGSRAAAAWSWSDPAARDTRLHTRADGTGGEPIERWATAHGAATVDVVASAVDAASESDDVASEGHADPAGSDTHDPLDGLDAKHQSIVAEFEREIGIEPDDLDAEDREDFRQGITRAPRPEARSRGAGSARRWAWRAARRAAGSAARASRATTA